MKSQYPIISRNTVNLPFYITSIGGNESQTPVERKNGYPSHHIFIFLSGSGIFECENKTYTVKAGDNLYNIAKKYNTTVDKIKRDNNLQSNNLTIGKILLIEDTGDQSTIEACFGEEYEAPSSNITYTVQKGDSLYSIANKYNTTINEIKSLNNLTSNNLSIGQQLRIPTNASGNITYTVQKGDNLYSIARKYNTTVNEIKRKNNLTSNNLSIGQQLII